MSYVFVHLQFDSKGRNFLHLAIQNVDVETVLFLIGVSVNVNSRIQDSSHRTPLHLAVSARSEIIVRHLVRFWSVFLSVLLLKFWMTRWLARWTLDRVVRVRALAGVTVLCSCVSLHPGVNGYRRIDGGGVVIPLVASRYGNRSLISHKGL